VPGRHEHDPRRRAGLLGPSGHQTKHGPARLTCRASPVFSNSCWAGLRAFYFVPGSCWPSKHGPNLQDYLQQRRLQCNCTRTACGQSLAAWCPEPRTRRRPDERTEQNRTGRDVARHATATASHSHRASRGTCLRLRPCGQKEKRNRRSGPAGLKPP
jgi:hypothetical protein